MVGNIRMRLFLMTVLLSIAAVYADKAKLTLLTDNGSRSEFAAAEEELLPVEFPASKRSRAVSITPGAVNGKGLAVADELVLNFFEDTAYTAVIDRIKTNTNDTVMIRGRLKEYPLASVLISTTQGRSMLSLDIPETGQHFLIQSEPVQHSHYLLELDNTALDKLEDAPSQVPDVPAAFTVEDAEEGAAVNDPLDPVNIDIMIVYTPAAALWAEGSGGIENVIAQAMQKADLALANSETYITMTLVHSQQIEYTESGESGTDLSRLTSDEDSYMNEVHTLRDAYGADMVVLFTKIDDTGGIGWLLNSPSGSPDYAFSISRIQQVGWTYTMIHELGHNMGCHHHADQTFQPGPGIYFYSAGWRWTGFDNGKYCSIMTYESGDYFADGEDHSRVAYFSNPSLSYEQVPTGDAVYADNARTLRETKDVVAGYRHPVVQLPPTALNGTAVTRRNAPIRIVLNATDDGFPNPLLPLSYIITELPTEGGIISDPGAAFSDPNSAMIEAVPYTLVNNGNKVDYKPNICFVGHDSLQFKANDGGIAPDGGDSNTALVSITVTSDITEIVYQANMDTDPGWMIDNPSDWAWGIPRGYSGDPVYGATGSHVFGYNLLGGYDNNLSQTLWVTTPPIDCTGYDGVKFQFQRWLGVEESADDHAYLQCSNDRTNWVTLWQNSNETITDTRWTRQVFDISSIADNEATVYLRWGIGTTDNKNSYAGWNIDDVLMTGQAKFVTLPGDFEPDCDIDIDDLLRLIDHWQETCGDCDGADLLADGIVNLKDFSILAENWLVEY